jgi:hypothetical protein
MSLIEDEGLNLMQEAKPAPEKEQIKGSDDNKPGSAAGAGGDITVSAATETTLRNKVKEHNEKMKEDNKPDHTRTTYGQLAAVYRRGAGAYSSSHRPGTTRGQWAMARVNAYLYLLRNGKPENPKYNTDYDLLPEKHPKSTRNNAVLIENTTEVKLVDKSLQEKIDFAVEDTIMEEKVIEAEAASAEEDETVADVKDNKKLYKDEEEKKDMAYPKEDMAGHSEDEEDMMDEEEKKDMAYPKEDMAGHSEDEEEMPSTVAATELEDDDDAEKAKKYSEASFTESEREELERFRQEEKQKILESYKEFLSETVYDEFMQALTGFNRDTLEKELKLKVADYFMTQAKENEKAKKIENQQEFKTLQVLDQLRDKQLGTDISKLVDKYKK